MQNLLQEDLEIHQDCIFGSLGFSFTASSINYLSKSIYSYCIESGINKVIIGYDSSEFAKKFSLEVVAKTLCNLGLDCYYVDHPCPIFQLSWLTAQCKKDDHSQSNFLGLYLGSDSYYPEKLSIYFRTQEGLPFSELEVANLAQYPYQVSVKEDNLIRKSLAVPLDISLYTNYLSDNKIADVTSLGDRQYTVDLMFGSTETLMMGVAQKLQNPLGAKVPGKQYPVSIVNLESQPQRLKNYVPIPTGSFLNFRTPSKSNKPDSFIHAGFSHDGRSLGIWDPKQGLEISPSGVFCILMYHAVKILKKKGTVLISKAASDKVSKVAEGLGLNVEIVDPSTDGYVEAITKKRRSPALMYGDEKGRFWFKGDVLDFNCLAAFIRVAEICSNLNKTPGQVVDILSEKYLNREYVYSNLVLPRGILDRNGLEERLAQDFLIEPEDSSGLGSVYRLETGAKITIQENRKQSAVEVFIESDTIDITKGLTTYVQKIYTDNPSDSVTGLGERP